MTFPTSAHDADAQFAEARRAAHAWLRATLSTLPAAVTSLSIGAVLDEGGDRPDMVPRLRATLADSDGRYAFPDDEMRPIAADATSDAWEDVAMVADDLRDRTAPFLFAIADEEWITVTRADLAAPIVAPVPSAAESETYRAIVAALTAMPPTSNLTLRFWRDRNGVLTWETKHKSF